MSAPHEIANIVDECAAKVGAYSTVGAGTHEERLAAQKVLTKVSYWLTMRAAAIRAGTVKGLYD